MPDTLQGFPFWPLEFGKDGTPVDPGAIDRFVTEAREQGLSDLFIFSHGWNNDFANARSLYSRFFGQVAKIARDPAFPRKRDAKIGVAGVLWPSILWPDDAPDDDENAPEIPPVSGGGPVAMPSGAAPPANPPVKPEAINATLKAGYEGPEHSLIDDLTSLLEKQPQTDAALEEFRQKLAQLLATDTSGAAVDAKHPETAEAAMVGLEYARWRQLLEQLGDSAQARGAAPGTGGAVGLGNPFKKLWAGAKDALRVATYWQMKQRAAEVGRAGLAPVLARLADEVPGMRIHLIGHSFGARLVSFSLSGLPETMSGEASPVKSLFLLQGAFSHFSFADRLPFDASRSGALKGMAARVDGPLLTTHSKRDYAVGVSYPAASFVSRDDAATFDQKASRWGAMGSDGAQEVNAAATILATPGTTYSFAKGAWLNLDANQVFKHGRLPAGAHSDIVHPEAAWAALAAAGVV